MSIIYDALNKINRNFYRKSENKESRNILLLLSMVAIFLGFIGSGIAVYLLFSSMAKPIRVINQDSNAIPVTALSEEKPEPLPISTGQAISLPRIFKPDLEKSREAFDLKGIMESGGERVALINNEILKEGDYLDGARVVRITKNTVELFNKDKILILRIK